MSRLRLLALVALAAVSLSSPVFALAHNHPMAPPLSVTCHGDFLCLHPGYAAAIASLTGLSLTGTPGPGDGCPAGKHAVLGGGHVSCV